MFTALVGARKPDDNGQAFGKLDEHFDCNTKTDPKEKGNLFV